MAKVGRRSATENLTQARLKELLTYNPKTGIFRWVVDRKRVCRGDIAGSVKPDGYRRIMIDFVGYYAHRLAWLYMNGEWPQDQIDHKNGDRDCNRFSNLREATPSQNGGNKKNSYFHRSPKGTSFERQSGKWRATICINDERMCLGRHFRSAEQAAAAYRKAAKRHFKEFARCG